MATLTGIPQDIIEDHILSRLPVKSILRFRCVCKYWCYDLFVNPRFIKIHLQHATVMNKFNLLVNEQKHVSRNPGAPSLYSIDHNVLLSSLSMSSQFKGDIVHIDYPYRSDRCSITFHGSCNGLVCIGLYSIDIGIWNPSTKEYKLVPETPVEFPSFEAERKSYRCAYGFGYDCKIDDYKLLRIVNFSNEKGSETVNCTLRSEEVSEARVYRLGSNSWRCLGFIPRVYSKWDQSGTLVDGALHWLASTYHTETGIETKRVASFDICAETFRNTSLPHNHSINSGSNLCMWEGKLCLVSENVDEIAFTVWTMEDYTWSKQLNINEPIFDGRICRWPIQVLQNGEILFTSYISEEQKHCLISYDPKLECGRVLNIPGLGDLRGIEPYIGTLVSIS